MWDILFALAQLLSFGLVIAGFVLVTWYGWSRSSDDPADD